MVNPAPLSAIYYHVLHRSDNCFADNSGADGSKANARVGHQVQLSC